MNVLHVIPAVAPRYGGPSQAVVQMCRALMSRGIKQTIATTNADGPGVLPVDTGRETQYEEVPAIFFPRTFSERFKYSPGLSEWLRAEVHNYDAVHIHAVFSHSTFSAASACLKARVPYVIRPLGSLDPWSLSQNYLLKRVLLSAGLRRLLERASAIHYTTAEEMRLSSIVVQSSSGVVVPLGVDEARWSVSRSESAENSTPQLLFLARLHPKKGVELLLQAFRKLQKENALKQWRLIIAGSGESNYVAELRSQAGENVEFVGWIQGVEKYQVIQRADLFVLPSQQENFGISVAEAMALGVPVIVSKRVNLADEIVNANAGW